MNAMHSNKATKIWVSMYNAAVQGMAAVSMADKGYTNLTAEEISHRAIRIADIGHDYLATHVIQGSRADVFCHES